MIIEAYYVVAVFAMFFTYLTFKFKGKIFPPVAASLMYGLLAISSGSINVCGTNAAVCDYTEGALVYVFLALSLTMLLVLIIDIFTPIKEASEEIEL